MLHAIFGLLIGLTINIVFFVPNKADIEQIVRDQFTKERELAQVVKSAPLAPAQIEWLRNNGPFERVLCQASGSAVEYRNAVTGKTVTLVPGGAVPKNY